MTQHLLEAMKPDKFPEIVYRLERYEVTGAQAQATGTITINGVTAPISPPTFLLGRRGSRVLPERVADRLPHCSSSGPHRSRRSQDDSISLKVG